MIPAHTHKLATTTQRETGQNERNESVNTESRAAVRYQLGPWVQNFERNSLYCSGLLFAQRQIIVLSRLGQTLMQKENQLCVEPNLEKPHGMWALSIPRCPPCLADGAGVECGKASWRN